jgi:predicted transcriptional regulator
MSASQVKGVTKTTIMYEAYLSYAQLMEYLSVAIQRGLLEYDARARRYRTTKKGIALLETHLQQNGLVDSEKKVRRE